MKSMLRIAIPIILLMAVVFGVTFFAQYTPPSNSDEEMKDGFAAAGREPPLRFFASTRSWDPPLIFGPFRGFELLAPSGSPAKVDNPDGFSLQDRIFHGAYEPGNTVNSTSFWFENRNDKGVSLQLTKVSCTMCSGGSVAAVPPAVAKQILQMTGVSCLPQGLVTGLPTGLVGPAANFGRLQWTKHQFRDSPNSLYRVPAADNADGWSPQWGILDLHFEVQNKGVGARDPLKAEFIAKVDGTDAGARAEFSISYEAVNPFEISQTLLSTGELTENSEPRKYEMLLYSSTRGPNTGTDLPVPDVSVRMPTGAGDPGPFVAATTPVRVPQAELLAVTEEVIKQLRRPVRVESAYRMTVTVSPKIGDQRMDIGILERDIALAVPSADERQIHVRGLVRGPVWLDNDRTNIEISGYKLSDVSITEIKLVTERRDAEVSVVPDAVRPKFLKVELKKDAPRDYGYYTIRIEIPKGSPTGSWSGEIMLEVKGVGPAPQKIRIPIKGRGTF